MQNPLLKLPPLDPLRCFVVAARFLSFTRAAEELCLTQSAISRQVQTLESAIGAPLFIRGVRRVTLTPEGARLATAAEGWLNDYARLADLLRMPATRAVTVSTTIGVAALWLVPRLSRFQQRHPDIDVRLAASNQVVDLTRDGIDLAIRYSADQDAPGQGLRLFGESIVPVASPALGIGSIERKNLPECVLLEYEDPRYPWLRWGDWLAALGLDAVRPRAVLSFTHYDQVIQAALAGQGVAIGRTQLVSELIAEGRLRVVGNGRDLADRSYWLIPAPGDQRPEVACFADWIREEALAST